MLSVRANIPASPSDLTVVGGGCMVTLVLMQMGMMTYTVAMALGREKCGW